MLQLVLGPLRRPGVSWRRIVTSGRTVVSCLTPLVLAGCPQLMEDEFDVGSASQPGTASGSGGTETASAGTGGVGGSGPSNNGGSGGGGSGSSNGGSGSSGSSGGSNANGGSGASQGGTGGTNIVATPSCGDGAMNGLESGVDCGGECDPCGCDGTFEEPELLTGFGLDPKLWGPMPAIDNETLYFSRQDANQVENIYQATRSDRGTVFSLGTPLTIVNSSTAPDGTPFLSPDGLSFYLFSIRTGGIGDRDLYISTRNTTADDFSTPVLVGNVNSTGFEYLPWLAPDRLSLYFVSNRPGGQGASDIWVARRGALTDQWTTPTNVSELNTTLRDEGMTLSRDGLSIIFASNRAGGAGNVDLWLALRTSLDAPFSEPVNLTEVNTGDDEVDPHLSNDGHELFFSSNRDGEQLLYRAWRDCP